MKSIVVLVGDAIRAHGQVSRAVDDRVVIVSAPDVAAAQAFLDALGPDASASHQVVDGLRIDLDIRQIFWHDTPLDLSDQEVLLLSSFTRMPLRVWTFQELLDAVWGEDHRTETAIVRTAVKRLRRKLSEAHLPLVIESVRGVGFRPVVGTR